MTDEDPKTLGPRQGRRTSAFPNREMSMMTLTGWFIVGASFAIGLVLLVAEFIVGSVSPYISLVTYSFPPAGITIGVALILLSVVLRWRRRRKGLGERPWPTLDLNSHKVHVGILIVGLSLVGFVTVSGVATYQAYHFTESTEFCGTVCHQVMQPEYEARFLSPHARVSCVECHIGPGADWYVRSKFSGLRQVYGVVTGNYHLPINTPIANLRPARDTCEQCHWPAKFEGSIEKVLWRYWYDRDNTPSRFHLLMKVGGVRPETGRPEGIHWHSNSDEKVWYWARDEDRQDVPWVEVVSPNGKRKVYSDGSLSQPPPRSELRQMDCIDCHNRPAHKFKSPNTTVDAALAEGHLDSSVPYLKRNSVQLLSLRYNSYAEAERHIRQAIEERYAPVEGVGAAKRKDIADTLVRLYKRHNYPDQGVNWRTYQSNIGHKTSPGCFRCHGGDHKTAEGKAISHDCETCHQFIHQAHGEAAYGEVTYRRAPFEHPGRETEDFKTRTCDDCHNERVGWYPGNVDDSIDAAPKEEDETPAVQAGAQHPDQKNDAATAAPGDGGPLPEARQ